MSKNTMYDIWTDGSFRDAHNIAGAGWLIRHNGAEREGHKRILQLRGPDRPHGSDIAEIFAVVCALREVPPGSQVVVRLECQNVCDWLNNREINKASKRQSQGLMEWFQTAMLLSEQLDSFSVSKISGRMNEGLNRVHKLSQIASSPHR